jgi:hypothetical protein
LHILLLSGIVAQPPGAVDQENDPRSVKTHICQKKIYPVNQFAQSPGALVDNLGLYANFGT